MLNATDYQLYINNNFFSSTTCWITNQSLSVAFWVFNTCIWWLLYWYGVYLFIIKQVPVVNMKTNKIVCISCIMHDTKIADSNENKSSNISTILTFSLNRSFNRKMCFIYFSSFLAKWTGSDVISIAITTTVILKSIKDL